MSRLEIISLVDALLLLYLVNLPASFRTERWWTSVEATNWENRLCLLLSI
jgi:hypothetical protein